MAARPVPLTESKILRAYAEKTPGSRSLHNRAKALLPDGVTHVGRFLEPHPIYVERAAGSRKWDVDGNEYVDYLGGHGALILGHNHPAVVEAVTAQAAKGVHYGACHALEVEWAELVQQLIPSAQRVRFTVTGTEATHLALRVSRAFTGKSKIIRFAGHFHGWHDHVCFPPGGAPGIIAGIVEDTLVAAPNDLQQVEHWLASRDDIAALILEPTGATFGQIPTTGETLRRLRELTTRHGVLLIFDEVISGFRCSPGGAQQFYGVTPDLTTLAKILAGGYPGAALAGRADVLQRARLPPARRDAAIAAGGSSGNLQRRTRLRRGGHCDARGGPPQRRHRPRGRGRPRRFATESTQQSAAAACGGAPTASSRISTSIAATNRLRRFTRARLRGRR